MIFDINVWVEKYGVCPFRQSKTYQAPDTIKHFHTINKQKTVNYDEKIREQFFVYFAEYIDQENVYPINYRIIGVDTVDPNEINVILLPGDDTQFAHELPGLVLSRTNILKFAKENNILILITWLYEYHIMNKNWCSKNQDKMLKDFEEITKILPPNNFQFLINSYDENKTQHEEHLRPWITHINCFNKISKFKEVLYDPYEKHTYKLIVPLGAIKNRWYRLDILASLHKKNILWNDDVLYTSNAVDTNDVITWFKETPWQENFPFKETYDIIIKNPEKFIRHKILGHDGIDISNALYNYARNRLWYAIPPQFLDTKLLLVTESRPHAPSITEKVYRPLATGQPFVWMAHHNLKPFLESKGYKFYPWIDYSFDSIEDMRKRFLAVMEEVERLYHLPDLAEKIIEYDNINMHNAYMYRINEKDISDMYNLIMRNVK